MDLEQNNKNIVALYTRVSTTHQVEEGVSLVAQRNNLLRFAENNEYKVYKIYEELGKSGKNVNRPAFQEMMQDMRDGRFNKIVVFKLDRISRSIVDLENIIQELQKYHCGFESASEKIDTTSAMGLMFIRLLGIFAQFERERISERICDAFNEKINKGEAITGSLPIGYKIGVDKDDKKIVIKDTEYEDVVKDMFDTYERTNSLQDTADYLKEKYSDILDKTMMTSAGISRTLDNKLYYGYYHGNDSYCEPYVTKERWENLYNTKKEKNIKGYDHTYIFSSLLVASCGHKMSGHNGNGYRCSQYVHDKTCSCNHVTEKYIEKEFLNIFRDSVIKLIDEYNIKISNSKQIDKTKKIKTLEDRKQKIINSFINGWIEESEAKFEIQNIDLTIKELKKDTKIDDIEILKKIIKSDWREKYETFTPEEKQAFIRNLNIDYIYVDIEKYKEGWRDNKSGFLTIYFK